MTSNQAVDLRKNYSFEKFFAKGNAWYKEIPLSKKLKTTMTLRSRSHLRSVTPYHMILFVSFLFSQVAYVTASITEEDVGRDLRFTDGLLLESRAYIEAETPYTITQCVRDSRGCNELTLERKDSEEEMAFLWDNSPEILEFKAKDLSILMKKGAVEWYDPGKDEHVERPTRTSLDLTWEELENTDTDIGEHNGESMHAAVRREKPFQRFRQMRTASDISDFEKFLAFHEYELIRIDGVVDGFDSSKPPPSQKRIYDRYKSEFDKLIALKTDHISDMDNNLHKLEAMYGSIPKYLRRRDEVLLQLSNEYRLYTKFDGGLWGTKIKNLHKKFKNVLPEPTWDL